MARAQRMGRTRAPAQTSASPTARPWRAWDPVREAVVGAGAAGRDAVAELGALPDPHEATPYALGWVSAVADMGVDDVAVGLGGLGVAGGRALGVVGQAAGIARPALGAVGAGLGAADVIAAAPEDRMHEAWGWLGAAGGGFGGGVAGCQLGSAVGGALGTLLLPGVGTALGAAVGAGFGSLVGGAAGGAAGEWLMERNHDTWSDWMGWGDDGRRA